jgi:hypothetical protein
MSIRLFFKTFSFLILIGVHFIGESQNLRDFDWTNYSGFVVIYKQPACTKCFTELADYFDSLKPNEKIEFACIAPMNSVFRKSTRDFVCELTHSSPESIKFITRIEDIGVEGEKGMLFPYIVYFDSGKVIKEFEYLQIFTATSLNTKYLEEFLRNLHL